MKLDINLKWDSKLANTKLEEIESFSTKLNKPESLNELHRALDSIYYDKPWPSEMKCITLLTEAKGNHGDVVSAAKVIKLIHKMEPSLFINWVVCKYEGEPKKYLHGIDESKVKIIESKAYLIVRAEEFIKDIKKNPPKDSDFLISGPTLNVERTSTIKKFLPCKGPRLDFLENAQPIDGVDAVQMEIVYKTVEEESKNSKDLLYKRIHKLLFSSLEYNFTSSPLVMGLTNGSGILLDPDRDDVTLSLDYCCPSYLDKLEDKNLKKDIFESFNVHNDADKPDYQKYSLNFGYAHNPGSWGSFISDVAIHEALHDGKQVIIVLNQDKLAKQFFYAEINSEFLEILKYKNIKVIGEGKDVFNRSSSESEFTDLVVILRKSFTPNDMKYLQLSSERIMATGDNSAAEAFQARCKLYVYEIYNDPKVGFKDRFLKQQIKIAQEIYPPLAKFLDLKANPKKGTGGQIFDILKDPKLSEKTLEFCQRITKKYSFKKPLLGDLKRKAWHHVKSGLLDLEAELIDDEFKSKITEFLKDFNVPEQNFQIHNLPKISTRVNEEIRDHLEKTKEE